MNKNHFPKTVTIKALVIGIGIGAAALVLMTSRTGVPPRPEVSLEYKTLSIRALDPRQKDQVVVATYGTDARPSSLKVIWLTDDQSVGAFFHVPYPVVIWPRELGLSVPDIATLSNNEFVPLTLTIQEKQEMLNFMTESDPEQYANNPRWKELVFSQLNFMRYEDLHPFIDQSGLK